MAHMIRGARQETREHDRSEEDVGKEGRGLALGLLLSVAFWVAAGAIIALWWT